jgi:hypothetical protein
MVPNYLPEWPQRRLFVICVAIFIVGFLIVKGIQAYNENQKEANQDAMITDAIRIASDAQAWALKPAAFGGGDGDFQDSDGNDLTFADLGYTDSTSLYTNVNGTYRLEVTGGGSILTVIATGIEHPEIKAYAYACGADPYDLGPFPSTTRIPMVCSKKGLVRCGLTGEPKPSCALPQRKRLFLLTAV